MVVKIYAAAPSCSSAVGYNERKVAEGSASVLSSSAIKNPENPMETFLEFERGSLRCQNMSFHASVNPGEGDHMTDEKIREFVKDYMENSKFGPISNVDQWFKTIRIDFPVDPFDPACTFFSGCLGTASMSLCQKDAQKENPAAAVSK